MNKRAWNRAVSKSNSPCLFPFLSVSKWVRLAPYWRCASSEVIAVQKSWSCSSGRRVFSGRNVSSLIQVTKRCSYWSHYKIKGPNSRRAPDQREQVLPSCKEGSWHASSLSLSHTHANKDTLNAEQCIKACISVFVYGCTHIPWKERA